ncbi:cbb3-type cytochrome oxidase subunit 3 [Microbulbifer discodermiae]|uniref:cbb3-type cytochrome oxidase subunit 3 n=1 Tax=Microbulbifer sp. 2201CG32-9 TaxID=3232309 RepID=UPI00345C0CC1
MDINVLRQIAVVLGAVAFIAICWWAFSPKRKKRFEEDAQLPFADEEQSRRAAYKADGKDIEDESVAGGGQEHPPSAEQNKGQDKQ